MSKMLHLAIHLFDAGIACLGFLTPCKQLVQGSTRMRVGSWMETACCGHKILCISASAANYSSGWIPADVLGKQDCRPRDQGEVLKTCPATSSRGARSLLPPAIHFMALENASSKGLFPCRATGEALWIRRKSPPEFPSPLASALSCTEGDSPPVPVGQHSVTP